MSFTRCQLDMCMCMQISGIQNNCKRAVELAPIDGHFMIPATAQLSAYLLLQHGLDQLVRPYRLGRLAASGANGEQAYCCENDLHLVFVNGDD